MWLCGIYGWPSKNRGARLDGTADLFVLGKSLTRTNRTEGLSIVDERKCEVHSLCSHRFLTDIPVSQQETLDLNFFVCGFLKLCPGFGLQIFRCHRLAGASQSLDSRIGKWVKWSQLFVGKQRFFLFHFLSHFPCTSYSSFIHVLFISYSLLILFIFCPMYFLFIHYSLPIHFLFMFIHTFSFPLTWETYQHSKKQEYFLLAISYLKPMPFKPQINCERGGTPQAPKKWFLTN